MGTDGFAVRSIAPSLADDERFQTWYSQALRFAGTPASARAWFRITMEIDVRDVLPAIRVPTLVVHRSGDRVVPVESGRYLAEHIPDAKFAELPGVDHFPFVGDVDALVDEIEEFLTGSRRAREPDRVLATVLFTDIVGSTQRAAELGDRRWTGLLAEHHRLVRAELERHRGRVVRIEGDGTLSTFDGPARAVRCASAIRDALASLGVDIRAGLHTGEIELAETGVEGIAVHIGARVAALATPGEVLVEHREGPRRRLGDRVRRPRHPRAQRRARRVAGLRRRRADYERMSATAPVSTSPRIPVISSNSA